jgi:hypothetical protein
MTAPSAEFAAQVEGAVQAERAARIESLGRDATLWLAAAPLWTLSAAKAAQFPAADILDFVKRARDAGWCQTRGSLRDEGAGELRFWMPNEVRRTVLGSMIRQRGGNPVIDDSLAVAFRVAGLSDETGSARRSHIDLPRALRDWAGLLWDGSGLLHEQDMAQALVDWTRGAVEDGDLSGAQDLVSAGEALAALLGGITELAVDRARRLLSLGTRRRQDGRALTRYLDRPELSGAVDRLLRPETEQWALHLRGVGGVGKTMLIRYLASGRYAADRDRPAIPIARVDFDHMNPDYPVRKPVQLLLELADELALHTAAVYRADRALNAFRSAAAEVHESLSDDREEHPEPMRNPLVLDAIDAFAAVLGQFPEVLLILDTCEELAKADAGDPTAPAVRNTLAILERIHGQAPSVRVLFAGRRPLPARDYLAKVDVAGFTLEEASRYLTTFSATPLGPGLADAMIRQSPAVDSPGSRVSPFDLALYLAWADEDPGLDPRRVSAGSDAYIEGRIIERLHDPGVLAALPLLATAGRCRVETIAKLTGGTATALGPRLADQEWIDHDGDPPLHVAAKPALASRLRHYFEAPDRAAGFAHVTTELAKALRGQLATAPLGEIDVDELLAALRLSEPAAAVFLWDDLAKRAALAGRWNWLLNVTSRVLGESEEERWPTARALRATVLASYIAASRRASATFNARAAWDEVRASAGDHPDPDAGRVLLVRAALGVLPYAPDYARAWDVIRSGFGSEQDSPTPRIELAAAASDTVYRLLEAGAREQARLVVGERFISAVDGLPGATSARVRAWVFVALGRLQAARGDRAGAVDRLGLAEFHAMTAAGLASDAATEPGIEAGLADWIPPSDLLARVRLERGLIGPPDGEDLAVWEPYAADKIATVDGERLASLCVRTRLGHGIIPPSDIERWEEIDRYEQDRVATCSAHDLVPPLFATLADAWLAAGYPQRALDLIERRRTAALDTRGDDATIRHADAATVKIARRLRLDHQQALLMRLSRDNDPSRLELMYSARRATMVVYGGRPDWITGVSGPGGWHTWWQYQTVNEPVPVADWPAESTDTDLAADIELDIEEMRLLEHPDYESVRDAVAYWISRPRPSLVRSADPYRDVRAGLRRATLAGDDVHECPPEVPPRLFAEIAFDEAELLALRLPQHAARMFGYAYVAYGTSQDLIGQVLASASRFAITDNPPDLAITQAGLDDLTASQPDVGAAFSAPAEQAGPWRYWAEFLQRLNTDEDRRASVVSKVVVAERIAGWLLRAFIICAELVGVVLACWAVPAIVTIGLPSLVGLLLAAVVLTGTWRLRSVLRVADGRGVGVFGPPTVGFTALVSAAPADRRRVQLWAHVRELPFTPKRRWARLALMTLVAMLAAPFRRNARKGYAGSFRESLSWETDPPAADSAWWSAGSTSGVLSMTTADGARPWERIIVASLGPGATGRIAWYRSGTYPAFGSWWIALIPVSWRSAAARARVALAAPPEWDRPLGGYYAGPTFTLALPYRSPVRIRHAIGRAVTTSAGPRLDISGEQATSSSARELLGTDELTSGSPSLLVLQAEPVPDEAMGELDDLLQKLSLAVDASQECPSCDVLIVPAIPARFAASVAQAIARHADTRRRGDPRALQAKLRQLLGSDVPPAVLDDLVLFRNVVY